jgi:hypothetical protein
LLENYPTKDLLIIEGIHRSSVERRLPGVRYIHLPTLLVPQQIVGHSKVRVGSRYDGGYVCVNDFEGINTALSLGIGYNDDWDVAIAERGIVVHQFDHSIDEPPHVHQNCRFTKKKIVSRDDGTPNVETLGRLVDEHGYKKGSSLVLKMDVENDEWQIFAEMTAEHLAKFSQIICGFHLFSSVVGDGAYQRALHVLETVLARPGSQLLADAMRSLSADQRARAVLLHFSGSMSLK